MPSEAARTARIRGLAVAILLTLQAAAIAAAPFVPGLRYFAWAPFHEPARCHIQVELDGRMLDADLVARRYGLPRFHRKPGSPEDWQLNDIRNVLEVIEAYESTAGRHDRAQVLVEIRRTGKPLEVWRWPSTR